MRVVLSHRSALRFWRSQRADRYIGKPVQEMPAGLVPALAVEEALWLVKSFGVDVPVQNAIPRAAARRHAQTLDCFLHPLRIDPRHYIHVGKQLYVADPALTLAQVAQTLTERCGEQSEGLPESGWRSKAVMKHAPRIILAVLISEFCGRYALDVSQEEGYRQRPPLLSFEELGRFLSDNPGFIGHKPLEKALALADEGSNSPAETSLRMFTALPTRLGGRGLDMFRFNRQVCDCLCGAANDRYGDLVDLERKIVIEYRSKERHEHRGPEDDTRANELLDAGFKMFTVGPEQLLSANRLDGVLDKVERLVGRDTTLPTDFAARQGDLRAFVFELNNTRCKENRRKLVPVGLLPAGVSPFVA